MHPSPTWFAVLPDNDAALPVARSLDAAADTTIPHASGRPWIVGRWDPDELTLVHAGPARVALVGHSTCAAADLATTLHGIGVDTAALARRTRDLAGCFHLVASLDGRVWARGAASGTRRLFRREIDGVTVLADRADTLTPPDAAVDERALVLRLLTAPVTEGIEERSLWRGTHAVPTDHAVVLPPDGTPRLARWWSTPRATLSPAEGTAGVAEALDAAVRARTGRHATISADLSGGWDSTSLCFVAARTAGRLVTHFYAPLDSDSDDARWAAVARAALPDAEHHVLGTDELPLWFTDVGAPGPALDEPTRFVRVRAQFLESARRMAATGSPLHLNGQGGDELFAGNSMYLHDLFATRPLTALRHARGYRALTRWPALATVRCLADRTGYARALRRVAGTLAAPISDPSTPHFDWVHPARLPPWITTDALELAAGTVRAATADAEPLAPKRAAHAKAQAVRVSGLQMRTLGQLYRSAGVDLATPYLDDAVVAAVLRVDGTSLCDPYRFKPLLAAAMRGTVPDRILTRRTKGEFSTDMFAGLRRNRAALLDLVADTHLARMGLIDADALRAAITGPHADARPLAHVEVTLGVENWLRQARPAPLTTTSRIGGTA